MSRCVFIFGFLMLVSAPARAGFTDVTAEWGLPSELQLPPPHTGGVTGGAAFVDFDLDGDLDLFLAVGRGPNLLFVQEAGQFVELGASLGFDHPGLGMGLAVGDIDNDGLPDIYVSNRGPNVLLRNLGGFFEDVTAESGVDGSTVGDPSWGSAASFGDFNADGLLDLYAGNAELWDSDPAPRQVGCHRDRLYMNLGDGKFADVAPRFGTDNDGCTLGVVWSDYDLDGDLDIRVNNDYGPDFQPDRLYRNDGPVDGTWRFVDVAPEVGAAVVNYGMGLAPADFDNDGLIDFYNTHIGESTMLQNQPGGTFRNMAQSWGVLASPPWRDFNQFQVVVNWGSAAADFDRDGDQDLFVAAGEFDATFASHRTPIRLADWYFENRFGEGSFGFDQVTAEVGLGDERPGRGAITGDFDGDGDPDLFVWRNGRTADGGAIHYFSLYRNDFDQPDRHWLRLRLEGTASNRPAIGARVEVTAGGQTQVRELYSGASYMSSHEPVIDFGLGGELVVTELRIHWPSGREQVLENVLADQTLLLFEPGDF